MLSWKKTLHLNLNLTKIQRLQIVFKQDSWNHKFKNNNMWEILKRNYNPPLNHKSIHDHESSTSNSIKTVCKTMLIFLKIQNLVQSKYENFTKTEKKDLKAKAKDSISQNSTMKLQKRRKQSKKPSLSQRMLSSS